MKLDKNLINTSLDEVHKYWDMSGAFFLIHDDSVIHNNCYGYENRLKELKNTKETAYTLDAYEQTFVNIAALILIDQGRLKLSDRLSKFVPDYQHADKIQIRDLLRNESGISDFYYGKLMVTAENEQSFAHLEVDDRIIEERTLLYKNRSFDKVYKLIEHEDLEVQPGKDVFWSESNAVFLAEVIKRSSGQDVYNILEEYLFKPLNISLGLGKADTLSYLEHERTIKIPVTRLYDAEGLFCLKADGILKLLQAFSRKEVFSEKMWSKILKYKRGRTLLFSNANGYECISSRFLGFTFNLYLNFETGIFFASMFNEQQLFEFKNESWHYFNRDSREIISSLTTFPLNTKMVKLNKDNFWKATDIGIEDDQTSFVLDTKSSIGMGLVYPTKKTYLQMEGQTAVGLLVLDINKKNDDYNIDIIIIDKKYQNRGYGKHMVSWAVDKLKSEGAKKLSIGVARSNIAAKKIYMNAGFVPHSVSEGGMDLVMEL